MRRIGVFLAVALMPTIRAAKPNRNSPSSVRSKELRPGGYAAIAFSPDGKILASSDLGRAVALRREGDPGRENDVPVIKLWDVKKRKVVATLRGGARPLGDSSGFSVAFSPDGKMLAAAGQNLTLFDVATGKERALIKAQPPVAFSPNGKLLATGGPDGTVKLWDLTTGKAKTSFKGKLPVSYFSHLTFSPDGKLLASGGGKISTVGLPGEGEVRLWDVTTGRERDALKGRIKLEVTLRSLSYLKAEGVPKRVLLKLAALNGRTFPTEEDVERELPKILEKALNKEQRKKYLRLVRGEVRTVHEGPELVCAVAFSPDGKSLASASALGSVVLWDVPGGKRIATLQRFNPHSREENLNPAYSVAFSPDGKTLAAGTLRGLKLWDVKSGDRIAVPSDPSGTVWSVAFSPDGKMLASAGSKGVIGPRDRREGEPILRLWRWAPARKADR